MSVIDFYSFLTESNKIEGIHEVKDEEVACAEDFLGLDEITSTDVRRYVWVTAKAKLRENSGMDVRIGYYSPLPGGEHIRIELNQLLEAINMRRLTPYEAHIRYELLHPFMDGNGRSGRLIWLWHMDGHAPLNFLHQFYYQVLEAH